MMQKIIRPEAKDWEALCERPKLSLDDLEGLTKQVFSEIRLNGDDAVRKFSGLFDGTVPERLKLSHEEMSAGAAAIPQELKKAIHLAATNIERFHASQKEEIKRIETVAGVTCWRESRAIEKIGIYIPGGSAPLFSTVLMLGIPAKIAGCREIILCTPPGRDGKINNAILYAAQLTGIENIYCIGGIQAIAAMAIGTQSVPRVDKIFGPGNQYVAAAKQTAYNYGVATDLPAGPSEVLIIAGSNANIHYVAADLLSQAEHGPDSQVVLLSDDERVIDGVFSAMAEQIASMPRKDIALQALQHSKALLLSGIGQCIDFSNQYAPEHLILACEAAEQSVGNVRNAGSVFLGRYSCESAGDYASGTNHTLPTNGYARNYSGVSLDSFIRKITFQKITPQGLKNIGPTIEVMAAAEQLEGHKNAVTIRLKDINNV